MAADFQLDYESLEGEATLLAIMTADASIFHGFWAANAG
jgi:hypothetical protein